MIILSLKTDNPISEIALFDNYSLIDSVGWEAHRSLADTIHHKLLKLLEHNNVQWKDIQGIIIYKGPGSFTGLRIGMSVANALALGLETPIVSSSGDTWQEKAIKRLLENENEKISIPAYGGTVFTTKPNK